MEANNNFIENNSTQMRRGVLEYSILLILALEDEYASSIIQKLKDVDIIVAEGTVYPLLIRLKKLGLLNYRWEESPQGPPRKYYNITDKGREIRQEQETEWRRFSTAINKLLDGEEGKETL